MNPEALILLLGGAALLYYYYTTTLTTTTTTKPSTTSTTTTPTSTVISTAPTTGTTTTAPPTTTSPSVVATTTTPPAPVPFANTLASIQSTIAASGISISSLQSADVWNYYAMQAIPGFTAPAPETLFPALVTASADNAHQPVTFQTWWAAIQAYLPAGLTGFGNLGYVRSGMFPYGGWRGGGWAT